jgi:hypothetical protein
MSNNYRRDSLFINLGFFLLPIPDFWHILTKLVDPKLRKCEILNYKLLINNTLITNFSNVLQRTF